ncbi:MAG TPA: type IV secretion system DNA-binding domain-containing protein [Candidatus Paceibacterota bacterium]|nr:type IV secretion system DNA-binding domain-containing protein [Candidatus Paceibacterota bacterium]
MENPERVTYFAATDSRGKHVPFGIKAKDRDRHMYIIGKTGMGKSTLLENLAIQDIRNGEGFAFLDPHGGSVDHLLDFIPENRVQDVVYVAPFDMEHPIAFNVMEDVGYDKRHLVVSGLMATFKKIWQDAWSARMEYILTNTLLALLEYPDATLLGVNRMYTDKAYRQKVVENVKDPVVKDFWTKEFANYGDRYTQEATPAIQNKVGQFTGNPLIRNIIGQPKSSFDIRQMMDEKKILLINLSKGLVGETNMRLLGSMLTTRIFLAAMSRANLAANELAKLPHFYFYVDEFQNFANETFAEILSESRKYKLNLVIAHQYIEQMEEEVRDAVFGNVGTTVTFRVGPFDAETLETIFMPRFTKEDIVNLDRRQIYLTLMIDGVGSAPFSAVTIPPIEPPLSSSRERIIASSREQFAAPRAAIESAILEELSESAESEAPADARMRRRPANNHAPAPRAEHQAQGAGERRAGAERRSDERRYARDESAANPRHSAPRADAHPRPQPQRAPHPVVESKSPGDLKAILRTMVAKTGSDREQKQAQHEASLKGALGGVLAKQSPPAPPAAPAPAPPPPDSQPKQPFEVPEDALRKVLKGET